MALGGLGNVLKKIGKAILPIAPVLASGLGGPAALAVPAVRILASALGLDSDVADVETQILAKIESATPADLLAIKQADNEYLVTMEQLGVDREKIHQQDRHSARQRQIETGDKFPNYLAAFTIGTFTLCVTFLLYHLYSELPVNKDVMTLINILFGALLVIVKQVYNYYFGSSAGSRRKSEQIEKLANGS